MVGPIIRIRATPLLASASTVSAGIRRKATGIAGRSTSPCSVGIGHRRDVGFCNIPRNLPTGPVNGLPCPRPMGSDDQIVMCGFDVVQSQGSEPAALASRSCLASWI
jgi:hypothetical protein